MTGTILAISYSAVNANKTLAAILWDQENRGITVWLPDRLNSRSGDTMFHELRYALRTLRNNPSFSAIAVLTLALGIGANTAMFSVVNGVLLRPLDYPNASRIVQLKTADLHKGRSWPRLSGPDFADVRSGASALEQVNFYWGGEVGVQMADHAEFVSTYLVTPGFFRVFGVTPAFGRGFEINDARRAAIVGLPFAHRTFGSGAGALGQTLRMEGVTYEIVGVVPATFRYPREAQVWLASSPDPGKPWGVSRTAYNFRTVALLKQGTSLDAANTQLQTIGTRLQAAFPASNKDKSFLAQSLPDKLVAPSPPTIYFLI